MCVFTMCVCRFILFPPHFAFYFHFAFLRSGFHSCPNPVTNFCQKAVRLDRHQIKHVIMSVQCMYLGSFVQYCKPVPGQPNSSKPRSTLTLHICIAHTTDPHQNNNHIVSFPDLPQFGSLVCVQYNRRAAKNEESLETLITWNDGEVDVGRRCSTTNTYTINTRASFLPVKQNSYNLVNIRGLA